MVLLLSKVLIILCGPIQKSTRMKCAVLSPSLLTVLSLSKQAESFQWKRTTGNQPAFFMNPSTNTRRSELITKNYRTSFLLSNRRTDAIFFSEPAKDEQKHQRSIMEKDSSLHGMDLMDNDEKSVLPTEENGILNSATDWLSSTITDLSKRKPPPIQIEDAPLLFYDIFLILNLSVSISFWVVHRMSFSDIVPAFSEGSLLSILWVIAGLWNGAFLYSAVDGHHDMTKDNQDKGGPASAAMLGLSTFVATANLRILVALATAFIEHRKVGVTNGEELIPLEIAFGLMLMSAWRMLHSTYSRV